jgi:hypothetical protein
MNTAKRLQLAASALKPNLISYYLQCIAVFKRTHVWPLFGKIIYVNYGKHMKCLNISCGQNVDLLHFKTTNCHELKDLNYV